MGQVGLRRRIRGVARAAGDAVTRWSVQRKVDRGTLGPLAIVAYRGWATASSVHIGARLLEDRGQLQSRPEDPWWQNAIAMGRRFLSSEIPGGHLRVRVGAQTHEAITNAEGYAWLTVENSLDPALGWAEIRWVLEAPRPRNQQLRVSGAVLAPSTRAAFGVISDLDDTVLRTGITDTVGMISTTLFNNAHTRLPFPGVAEFYRALNAEAKNPIFYVSTSPWNLYDVIDQFLDLRDIPAGPMFLTDWGLGERTLVQPDTHLHKMRAIERLLDAFPGLPFVLIGDSGQHDPEIYRDVVQAYPGRIVALYIRDVRAPGRKRELEAMAAALRTHGVALVHSAQTLDAAFHAHSVGLIDERGLSMVRSAVPR